VEQRLGTLWRERRAEGIRFAEEGWGIWYSRESALIRAKELRDAADGMVAAVPHEPGCRRHASGCACVLGEAYRWLSARAEQAEQESKRSL
jgi:hypothetical protein